MQLIHPVFAQGVNIADPTKNPMAKFGTISAFTNIFIPLMMVSAGFFTLAMLLQGAYKYITSEGNPEKLSKAQNTMVYAVLGLFLVVASYVFTKIIGYIFKVDMPL
jgi:ABC-type Fe3+ transport system permease subunit